jgi:diguanylate cyclase (GGDEF)-like protein/PAS domain S-box-containing protein
MPERMIMRIDYEPEQTGGDRDMVPDTSTVQEQLRQRTAELEAALHENERISRALREAEGKFHRLVEQSLVGISLSNGRRFIYVNHKFAEITGYSVDELLVMGPLDILTEADRPQAAEMLRQGMTGEISTNFSMIINVLKKDGTTVIGELTGGPPVDVDGEPALIAMLVDITDRVHADNKIKLLNNRLREQAIRDPLTNLFNRRYLEESLARELIHAERHGQTVGLVMGDLDHFKAVNDTHGHQAGDKVLRVFADLLRKYSRGSDIPCRYGGEEFLLLLPGINGDKALERAELLRAWIAATPIEFDGKTLHISASFGVAVFPEHARDADKLITAVDKAMYRAKAAGRNCVRGVSISTQ